MAQRLICATALSLAAGIAQADDIDWPLYMGSAHTATAIASAITLLGPCSVPITMAAEVSAGEHRLSFACQGGEDEEAAVFLFLQDFGDFLMPMRYEVAG